MPRIELCEGMDLSHDFDYAFKSYFVERLIVNKSSNLDLSKDVAMKEVLTRCFCLVDLILGNSSKSKILSTMQCNDGKSIWNFDVCTEKDLCKEAPTSDTKRVG